MARMFTSEFRPKSTTKKAKSIIRSEINRYYGRGRQKDYGVKSAIEAMYMDANACAAGRGRNDASKGKALVNAGCFACYYNDQRVMLNKIYGKKNVDNWSGQKIHDTYGSLIGREYASMLKEHKNKR